MYLPKKHYTIDEASHLLNVSKDTLRRWEEKGTLVPHRTRGGHRRYEVEQLQPFMKIPSEKQNVSLPAETPFATNTNFDTSTLYMSLPKDRKNFLKTSLITFMLILSVVVLSKTVLSDQFSAISKTVLNISNGQNKNLAINKRRQPSVLAAEALENPTFGINVDTVFRAAVNFVQGITTPSIEVAEDATINGNTIVGGDIDLAGDLNITGDIASTSDTVNLFNTNVTTINIGGEATELNIGSDGSTTTVTGNLIVTGTSDLQGAVTAGDTLAVDGATTLSSTLSVSGDSTLSGAITGGSSLTLAGLLDVNGTGTNDIAGTLNLSGNTLSSSADLLINPTGGGVSIGTGTASDVDLADGDLYITDDLEVDGVIYGTFNGSVNTGFTEGSVVFIDAAGGLAEDNTNFFWDDTNNRLGLGGQTSPQYTIDNSGTTRLVGSAILSSTLNVSGATTLTNTLDVTLAGRFLSTLEVTDNIDFNGTSNDIAGTLNLSGNSLTASGDLTINPAGGGTKIGAGTPVSADMAGSDLYVTGDFEVGGTIYGGLSGTVTTSFSQGSVVFITSGGAIAEDNTNFFWDDTNNRLSLGTNSGATTTLYVSGTSLVTGTSTFNGNMVLGDATSDTLTITSRVAGNLVPTTASTYDLGDATRTWETLYVDNIVAANISTSATDLNGTTASSFTINNDNATADTEDSTLVFDRGTPSVNAEIRWDSDSGTPTQNRKWISTNATTFAVNPLGETGITYSGKAALLVNQVQNQDLITASASGSTRFSVDIDGEITASGIGRVKIIDGREYAQTCAGINAAIDDLPSTGGKIYLPEGTYICNATITIDVNNTTIEGAGVGSVITAASAANGGTGQSFGHVINLNGKDNLILRDFKILGNAGGGSTNDLISDGGSGVTDSLFENLTLTNADDVAWSYASAGIVHTRNIFNNNTITSSDGSAILYGYSSNTTFSNNTFRSNAGGGLNFTESASFIRVVGNNFDTNTAGAIFGEGSHDMTITGNLISNHSSATGIFFYRGYNIVISSNNFNNNLGGVFVSNLESLTGGYLISNNNFAGVSTTNAYAVTVGGSGYNSIGLTIVGNYIKGYSGTGGVGINVVSGVTDTNISGNYFRNNTTNISDAGTTTDVINSYGGNTVIGGADGSPDTTLEVYRASGSDATFSMTDGDVAHGLTTLTDTDAFLKIAPISSTAGGAGFTAISDTDAQAFKLTGVMGSTNPTDTTSAIKLIGAKSNGTTGMADLGAAETVFAVANNDDSDALYITGNGNVNTPRLNKTIVVDGITYAKTCAGINAAIDALGSSGGEVYLPEGTYTCAEQITIDFANTTIRGAGWGTIIDASAGQSFYVIYSLSKNNVTVKDLQLLGAAGGAGTTELIYVGSNYGVYDHIYFKNSDADAIWFHVGTYNTVTNSLFDNTDNYDIDIGANYNTFKNNRMINIGSGSFGSSGGGPTGNIIEGNIGGTIAVSNFVDGTITGNTIAGSITAICTRCDISNNSLIGGPIQLNSTTTHSTIIGNRISYTGNNRALILFGIVDYNVISGNTIVDAGTGTDGIWNFGGDYNTISDNFITGFTNGITLDNGADGNNISNNQLTGNTNNITNNSSTNTTVINSDSNNTVIGGADGSPDTTLEIFRQSGADSTFSMTDGDVAHGLTTLANTDAFFHIGAISSTTGGTQFTAISDTDAQALSIRGIIGSTDPTDATSAVKIVGAKSNGTTGMADLAAAETVFSIANNDDTAALTILGDGKVGIGTVTPGSILDVRGSGATGANLFVHTSATTAVGNTAKISFGVHTAFTPDFAASIYAYESSTVNDTTDLRFDTVSSSPSMKMIIAGAGNVGIGPDTSPDYLLEINSAVASDATFALTDNDVAHGVTTLTDTNAFLHIGPISSTVGGARITAFADADGQALELKGIQSSDPTDATAAVKIVGTKANGTGVQDLAAAETVFSVANNDDANAITIYGDGSLVVGSPTGGAKGVGTINAVAVYDDNVLLTDYVFDKYFDGTVKPEDMDTHRNYDMLSIDEMGAFVAANRHLPTIAGRDEWIASGKFSLGALVTDIWETTETNSLYILELNDKLKSASADNNQDTTSLVTDVQDIRNNLENTNIKVNEQENKISQLIADIQTLKDQTLLASSSAMVAGTATQSAQVSTVDGITTLGDTVVTGKLNVGLLTLDSLSNSLDAIGNLKIQPLQLGNIELMGNLVQIDTKGNINIKQGQIVGNSSFRGNETLKAGENQLRIDRDWETSPVSITATPGFNSNIWITDKTEDGFTINFEKAPLEDTTVDWLAIW